MNYKKYQRSYFLPPEECIDWAKKDHIDTAPIWCSVDLRDGNQSLVIPMDLDSKIGFFNLLVQIGFKEIEVGFPAASGTEYDFLRYLVDQHLIPEDVTIQVLTQAREDIIQRTFEALQGCEQAIVHVYNPTSFAQRQQVFQKDKDEIRRIAVDGARLVREYTEKAGKAYHFEYTPESFSGTEPEFALDICNAVLDVWEPQADRKAIINLPSTVELSLSSVYASQVEYLNKYLKYRENVILSVHPHNDRGSGVADAELGLLAGAERVEGTLFGNGERTGNVDLITLALNLYMQGIDPKLSFDHMPEICERYEHYTGMQVNPRSPWSGALVFAAFSGSHQDAIAKGMKWNVEKDPEHWTVPYLPIDPADIGRTYDSDVIRINSQSGKGGIGFILETHYGLDLPKKMRASISAAAKDLSDRLHKELRPDEIFSLFVMKYERAKRPVHIRSVDFTQLPDGHIKARISTAMDNADFKDISATGNGRLDAVSNALKDAHGLHYNLMTYKEHALQQSTSSRAIAYVGIQKDADERYYWGAAVDSDIIRASIDALIRAINNGMKVER